MFQNSVLEVLQVMCVKMPDLANQSNISTVYPILLHCIFKCFWLNSIVIIVIMLYNVVYFLLLTLSNVYCEKVFHTIHYITAACFIQQ